VITPAAAVAETTFETLAVAEALMAAAALTAVAVSSAPTLNWFPVAPDASHVNTVPLIVIVSVATMELSVTVPVACTAVVATIIRPVWTPPAMAEMNEAIRSITLGAKPDEVKRRRPFTVAAEAPDVTSKRSIEDM